MLTAPPKVWKIDKQYKTNLIKRIFCLGKNEAGAVHALGGSESWFLA